ncbi:MAG: gamma-glutamyl-gamma-aminobutyrate hydrolase family protein [Actinomycetota bacterium]
MSAPKPRIALTGYRQRGQTGVWDTEMAMLPATYIEGITRSGGIVFFVPPQPATLDDAKAILASVDGLMVCGGRDVDSQRYGQQPHESAEEPDRLRDELENQLLTAAIEMKVPFLGICRGAQILNVNRGGSLIQHLPDVVGDNRYQLGNAKFNPVSVEVREDTRLAQLVGAKVENAALYHHQAIDEVGEGLKISAQTEDGIIEAIELESHPFGVAVQWHPEQTLEDLRLFEALIEAAKEYRGQK